MITLEKIPSATIELATYEPRNKLLAICVKSILNMFFFFFLGDIGSNYNVCS